MKKERKGSGRKRWRNRGKEEEAEGGIRRIWGLGRVTFSSSEKLRAVLTKLM